MIIPNKNFDMQKFSDGLLRVLPELTEVQQEFLRAFLPNVRNNIDAYRLSEFIKNPNIRRYPMVSVDTFLDSSDYLNIGSTIYPKVREICKSMIEGGYREGVEVGGIGSGKSFSSAVIACYMAHQLLCLRDPHQYYGLSKDKYIAIINMGINATQANEVVFTSIKSFMETAPFFLSWHPRMMSGRIEFIYEKILLTSGNSKATTPLGYNVFCGVLDEAAFYLDNDKKSVAQDIYESLQRRIVSRFGKDGLLMMISSPRYTEDFIMRKLDEAREIDVQTGQKASPHIFSIQLPTRKVKSLEKADMENKFYFNQRTGEIIEMPLEEIQKIYKINFVTDTAFDDTYDVREVPGEYKTSFRQNPDKAKRDFGATPSDTISGFFPNPAVLKTRYNHVRKNPLAGPGMYKFVERPLRIPYYIHIDIGLNRDGMGDHTGFAMGHFDGRYIDEATGEKRMKFFIDLVERIGAEGGRGEVDISKIRERIYDLRALGFSIQLVTLDGYQSKDFTQILRKKGIKADYLSVDRTVDAYNILKEAFMESRIDVPYYEPLDRELTRLELIKGVKVDHPPNGCFTGDTRVALLDGRSMSFEEIYNEYGKGSFWVYGNVDGDIVPTIGKCCRVTKRVSELVEVMIDNYTVVQCTPEHRFQLLDGTYKEAQHLTREDSLMPLYRSIAGKGGRQDYERVRNPRTCNRFVTHHKVASICLGFTGGASFIMHHKDENKMNNTPENLQIFDRREHAKYHTSKRHKEDKEYSRSTVVALRHGYSKYLEDKNDRLRQSRSSKQKNHRIHYVRRIQKECDVRDIETETSNFALANGVFVHNSKDCSDAVAGVIMNIATHTANTDMGIAVVQMGNKQTQNVALEQHKEQKAKIKQYELQRRMLDRQQAISQKLGL